jgi:cyclohexadieny/prephenate dehydrogenase / 3-phosphoshikimate 1-carboxyvinyltransferase
VTTLLVIGTGLIGGSFALASRAAGSVDRVLGCDADAATLAIAVRRGIVDAPCSGLAAGVAEADVVLVAVPPLATAAVVADVFACGVRSGAMVMDAASVKLAVIDAVQARIGRLPAQYVPAHPMAGAERHGPGAAAADLFAGCQTLLTPTADTGTAAVARCAALWRAVGAHVDQVAPGVHDAIVARTSHLPHLVAYAYMSIAAGADPAQAAACAGPGLRDFTRIAAADPALWRQIIEANESAMLEPLDQLLGALQGLRNQIAERRFDAIQAEFEHARALRHVFTPFFERARGGTNDAR